MGKNLHKTSLLLLFIMKCCINRSMQANSPNTTSRDRESRLFSLFNIVQFQQSACTTTADSTMMGTCMTSAQCSSAGGIGSGNCAAGFGICCMFTVSCSGTSSNTVNKNAGYPSTASASTTCTFTFNKIRSSQCLTDTVTVKNPGSSPPPVICGNNNGQHMYLETGTTDSTAGSIVLAFGAAAAIRSFKIKVTYYTCDNLAKAPAGCVQYFTGVSGSFQSYNFQGGSQLRPSNYQICIRQSPGYCSVNYNQDASTTPDTFGVIAKKSSNPAAALGNNCKGNAWVQIPNTVQLSDKFCGGTFGPVNGQTVAGTVVGNIAPFTVNTYATTAVLVPLTSVETTGYKLDYTQVPC